MGAIVSRKSLTRRDHNLGKVPHNRRKEKLNILQGSWIHVGKREREPEARTSTVLVRRKGKQSIVRSLHKYPDGSIVLLRILKGVQATPTLLGCMEMIR
jgi:hypothetical protein